MLPFNLPVSRSGIYSSGELASRVTASLCLSHVRPPRTGWSGGFLAASSETTLTDLCCTSGSCGQTPRGSVHPSRELCVAGEGIASPWHWERDSPSDRAPDHIDSQTQITGPSSLCNNSVPERKKEQKREVNGNKMLGKEIISWGEA